MPFGLSSAPRKFTKLLKPIVAYLRSTGVVLVIYIDDMWVTAVTYNECLLNVLKSAEFMVKHGFIINKKKSKPKPSHCVQVLGYMVDSRKMIVFLPKKKEDDVIMHCKQLLTSQHISIRYLARVIGKVVSVFPAMPLARAHYRHLEWDKNASLRNNGFDFNRNCSLSFESLQDLKWLINNIPGAQTPIRKPKIDMELFVDASSYGWGATLHSKIAKGFFDASERMQSINTKETLAVLFAINAFRELLVDTHLLVRSDNTTAVSTISKMGTSSHYLRNDIAVKIHEFLQRNNIIMTISHVPGCDNLADRPSRDISKYTEWMMPYEIFSKIIHILGQPTVDMFASRLNNRLDCYVSWMPDPFCWKVDAFNLHWDQFAYMFPPFILLSRVIAKIISDRATVILVYPLWKTQPWFPLLKDLLISPIYVLPRDLQLILPWDPYQSNPIGPRAQLSTSILSGNTTLQKEYCRTLPTSWFTELDLQQLDHMVQPLQHGKNMLRFITSRCAQRQRYN